MALRIGIVGAGGRMGQAVVCAAADNDALEIAAAADRSGAAALGKDIGTLAGGDPLGVIVQDAPLAILDHIDAVIDFTAPELSVAIARRAADRKLIHIVGTFSLGVNLLAALVKKAAATLDIDFDIEILEMHHRHKVDAPSGTALLLGEAAAEGRGIDLEQHSVRVRDGHTGPRESGSIGFATLRGGGIIGEHSVLFSSMAETVTFSHSARDRSLFADGALRAALWAADKPEGLYSMADVLGL
jgi:4-hydroxy-tetrahydrodipicolinate reductase